MFNLPKALVVAGFLLAGCASLEPYTDAHGVLLDSPRNYAVWTANVDGMVEAERQGRSPGPASDGSWPDFWAKRVRALRAAQPNGYPANQNPDRYVAYVRQARLRAGLPTLAVLD